MSATRRGFLAGAVASAAAPALARADLPTAPGGPPEARQRPERRGRAIAISPRGGPLVVAHDRRRTIAIVTRGGERIVDVGGQPAELAVSPGGRFAAVTTGFWDQPGLTLVDLRAGSVSARIGATGAKPSTGFTGAGDGVGPAPGALAFVSGGRIVVAGGEQEGHAYVVDPRTGAVVARAPLGRVPRGIAATPDGSAAWIALNGQDEVVRVSAATGAVTRRLATPRLPDAVAISPNGRRLLLSHGGVDDEHVTEIDLPSGEVVARRHVGRLPSAVAWTRRGRRLIALGGAGQVVAITAAGRRTRHRVGGSPRGLALAGNSAWTVDALTGRVARVRA
jgi:DNA-binding beta-propeller fold protein YncE